MCVREGESEDESRTTINGVAYVSLGLERRRMGMRVGLRWRVRGWCCMCIFGVGEDDDDGDEGGGKGE